MRKLQILVAFVLVGGVLAAGVLLGQSPEPTAAAEAKGFTTSAECASCHSEIAREQAESWHGQAYTDPDALALTKNFQDEQCVSCHAPTPIFQTGVGERVFARRERREEGVNCISCHLREDGTVAGRRGLTDAPCRPVADDRLTGAIHCAGCHNQHWTVDEFMAWRAKTGRTESCNDCHMPRIDRRLADGADMPIREGVASHLFPGGHDLATLKSAVTLEAEVVGGKVVARVTNSGAGHKIPTDSRHKSYNLLVNVWDEGGNWLVKDEEIAEYRLYYRPQNIDSTQISPGETREHSYVLPEGRGGRVRVDLVYCMKPPQKDSKEWTQVADVALDF